MASELLTRAAVIAVAAAVAAQAADVVRATPDAAQLISREPLLQSAVPREPSVERSRYMTIDFSRLPAEATPGRMPVTGGRIVLELFDGVVVRAVLDRFDPNERGVTWVGRVEGDAGEVTLVYSGGLLAGSISTSDAVYSIRPAPPDVRLANPQPGGVELHVLSEIDQSTLPPEAPPIPIDATGADPPGFIEAPQSDSADFIDLMVVYTPAAAAYAGGTAGILNLINLGLSETNTSYANSGVLQRLRLAHAAEVPYTETADFATSLGHLRLGQNGLAGVAALRDQYAADLVTMIVRASGGNACGIGYLMTSVGASFAPFAFSVTDAVCVSPNYTFAHELGHNMGVQHDWFVASSALPYSYAHGYVNPAAGQQWRTIMAYNDRCAVQGVICPRLLRWANPDLLHNGVPMGVPARTASPCPAGDVNQADCDADDRRALNNTALTVANFRQAVPAGAPAVFSKTAPASNVTNQPDTLTISWQAAANATSYEYCVDALDDSGCAGAWASAGAAQTALVSGLATGTTYYWQVRAVNASGSREANTGAWWAFSTPGNAVYDAALRAPRCSSSDSYCDSGALLRGRASIAGHPEPNQPNALQNSCSDGAAGTFHVDESIDKVKVFTLDGTPLAFGKAVSVQATVWSFSSSDRLDVYMAPNANSPVWTHVDTLAPPAMGQQTLTAGYTLPVGSLQAVRAVFRYGGAASSCGINSGYDDRDDLVFAVNAPINTNLITNGSFNAGTSGWSTFSLPTPADIVFDTAGAVFRYSRPPGSTQAVVFQGTGVSAPADVPLLSSFSIGNSTTARKRISVLVHDGNFQDLHVCTFWLDAGAAPATYTMRTRTTKAWTNVTISFYAATAGSEGGGFYLLDDVVLAFDTPSGTPSLDRATLCGDAQAPAAGGETSGPLLVNGGFDNGTIAPWTTFGNLASRLSAGVFEFFKLGGTPSGLLLQSIGQAAAQDQRFVATFSLGNSSGFRQRVTILLHRPDFQDLHACTFWVPPGQALAGYEMRTYATIGWSDIMMSIYPATVGTAPSAEWLRLDDVTLAKATVPIVGTACIEPGGGQAGMAALSR